MPDSILNSIKKVLNQPADYDAFDPDIIMHINSVFSTLNQLGIGPQEGFRIDDDTVEWTAFLEGDDRLNNVKSYMYLRVRMLFDPPVTSFHVEAMQRQITELEWRINVQREDEQWIQPVT
jgi:hypothetical protein